MSTKNSKNTKQAVKRGRGRPPVYAEAIDGVRVTDGWVELSEQANRTAPSGYRRRYPTHDFRVVPNTAKGGKPFVLQTRRLRKAEREAREAQVTAAPEVSELVDA